MLPTQPPAYSMTERYHHAMGPFVTLRPKLVLFVESSPQIEEFFYTQTGDMKESLFSALMEVIKFEPTMKVYGLEQLRDHGVYVFDATYQKIQKEVGENMTVPGILDLYKSMLSSLWGQRPPAVIGMPGILDRVETLMREDGSYTVISGVRAPYPSEQNRYEFLRLVYFALGDRVLRAEPTITRQTTNGPRPTR